MIASPPYGADTQDSQSVISDSSSFAVSERQNRWHALGYIQSRKRFPGKSISQVLRGSSTPQLVQSHISWRVGESGVGV